MKKFIPQSTYKNLPLTVTRIEWSEKLCRSLSLSIKAWLRRPNNGWNPKIAEDRLSCDWVLEMKNPPPFTEWGFRFGDVIHNLRSVLDNAVYEIALARGVSADLNLLEFPICVTEAKWIERKRRLRKLPDDVVEAIEKLQPYNISDKTFRDHLISLGKLNNGDKHRIPIVSAAVIKSSEFTVDATPYPEDAVENWHWNIQTPNQRLENGAVNLRLVSQERLKKIKGECRFDIKLVAADLEGNQYGLLEALAWTLDTVNKATERFAELQNSIDLQNSKK